MTEKVLSNNPFCLTFQMDRFEQYMRNFYTKLEVLVNI